MKSSSILAPFVLLVFQTAANAFAAPERPLQITETPHLSGATTYVVHDMKDKKPTNLGELFVQCAGRWASWRTAPVPAGKNALGEKLVQLRSLFSFHHGEADERGDHTIFVQGADFGMRDQTYPYMPTGAIRDLRAHYALPMGAPIDTAGMCQANKDLIRMSVDEVVTEQMGLPRDTVFTHKTLSLAEQRVKTVRGRTIAELDRLRKSRKVDIVQIATQDNQDGTMTYLLTGPNGKPIGSLFVDCEGQTTLLAGATRVGPNGGLHRLVISHDKKNGTGATILHSGLIAGSGFMASYPEDIKAPVGAGIPSSTLCEKGPRSGKQSPIDEAIILELASRFRQAPDHAVVVKTERPYTSGEKGAKYFFLSIVLPGSNHVATLDVMTSNSDCNVSRAWPDDLYKTRWLDALSGIDAFAMCDKSPNRDTPRTLRNDSIRAMGAKFLATEAHAKKAARGKSPQRGLDCVLN